MADLHTKTDPRERCAPIGRQLGLTRVEPSLPSRTVEGRLVGPIAGMVMEGSLEKKREKPSFIQILSTRTHYLLERVSCTCQLIFS